MPSVPKATKTVIHAPAALVAEILAEATADPRHEFWPDSFSVLTAGTLRWDRP